MLTELGARPQAVTAQLNRMLTQEAESKRQARWATGEELKSLKQQQKAAVRCA